MQTLMTAATISLTIMTPVAVIFSDAPRLGAPVLVVLPPWVDADPLVQSAGGQIIGPVSAPFATLARSDNPEFAAQVLQAGAWAVRDGQRLAKLCGVAK